MIEMRIAVSKTENMKYDRSIWNLIKSVTHNFEYFSPVSLIEPMKWISRVQNNSNICVSGVQHEVDDEAGPVPSGALRLSRSGWWEIIQIVGYAISIWCFSLKKWCLLGFRVLQHFPHVSPAVIRQLLFFTTRILVRNMVMWRAASWSCVET